MKSNQVRLTIFLAIAGSPILAAWLYYIGRRYSEGYYERFDTAYALIRPDVYDVLLFGAISQVGVFAAVFGLVVAFLAFLVLPNLIGIYLGVVFEWWTGVPTVGSVKAKELAEDWRAGKPLSSLQGGNASKIRPFTLVIHVSGLALLFFISGWFAGEFGEFSASTLIKDWRDNKNQHGLLSIHTVDGDVGSFEGYLIGCGDMACAFFVKQESLIVQRQSLQSVRAVIGERK